MPAPTPHNSRPKKVTGLRYWMLQVLKECERVSENFAADPVHDLRVSLRRCRSLADGLMAMDSDPEWKAMKKAGRRLFQRLGDLRDVQVMMEWVEKLDSLQTSVTTGDQEKLEAASDDRGLPSGGAAAQNFMDILRRREREQQHEAQAALEEFDRKQWRQWSKSLPARAARFRPGTALFKHLALERWTEARELHNRALRNRSQVALHSLRIGIKRFRYIVENFLPVEHKAWCGDLKDIQDVLGEIHDLDVLWSTAVSSHVFPDVGSRQRWHERILAERSKRLEHYRARMVGAASLWQIWRAGLPQGKQLQVLATRRMKLWAHGLDPDFPHSEHVASLSLQLYDGLLALGWQPSVEAASARSSLMVAGLLHDVGKSQGQKGHHKASRELIRAHGNPLGWRPAELQRAAIVARFHRGVLPTRRHKNLKELFPDEQRATIQLAAILRLANALDAAHDGHIRRVQIEGVPVRRGANRSLKTKRESKRIPLKSASPLSSDGAVVITAEGYNPSDWSAQIIAAERHLLEMVLRRPIIVKAMKHASARPSSLAGRSFRDTSNQSRL